ncbi:hypothetical protein [Jannaschia donghaensis]|uniref:hypothetical protein n=1 Tax=Jannaschia donghaensis TaxID=420998 RepID=UPI0011875556|nr:hypothetical protein [Jannaschia donghaensis]
MKHVKDLPLEVREELHQLLLEGGNINAVKMLRARFGLGLSAGKSLMEQAYYSFDYRGYRRAVRRSEDVGADRTWPE